ncbi:MAG: histidine--tRNA ligase [Oscillospiraceae bacterium]|jgi:histidyl-tRNA synthetase|nr:histidine--tRNA ligase [Oscillospiraceae bacterium]
MEERDIMSDKAIITSVSPGFMELLPEEQLEFDRIKSVIEETYRGFGFVPLDTPVIERSEALFAKAGGETEKQIYFVNKGREDLTSMALRFDLTVPLARYVADHFNDLSFPFRRYHISRVYRGERPQKGRFREFYQCDIDVIGKDVLSVKYDAEIPSVIYRLFKKLDFGAFTIRVNNRKVLNGLLRSFGMADRAADILRTVDKAEKFDSQNDFISALKEIGLGQDLIEKTLSFISIKGSVFEVVSALRNLGVNDALFDEGVGELETVTKIMTENGVDESYFMIDLSIARGLDYYTGTVYETRFNDYPELGSICSGGRFDDLASLYTEQKLPGVGISIGLTRLFSKLREIGVIDCARKTSADAVVVPISENNSTVAMKLAGKLREDGFAIDVLLEDMKVKQKFRYAGKKNAKFTVVIGDEEEAAQTAVLQYAVNESLVKENVPFSELAGRMREIRA